MKSCKNLKGGLQDVADDLGVKRIGIQHQAGSDSLLTCCAFFKLKKVYFDDHLDDSRFSGRLYGIGAGMSLTPTDQQGLLSKQISPNSILIDPSAP
jgi:CCR4-NOT transcription complex subunit 7/8